MCLTGRILARLCAVARSGKSPRSQQRNAGRQLSTTADCCERCDVHRGAAETTGGDNSLMVIGLCPRRSRIVSAGACKRRGERGTQRTAPSAPLADAAAKRRKEEGSCGPGATSDPRTRADGTGTARPTAGHDKLVEPVTARSAGFLVRRQQRRHVEGRRCRSVLRLEDEVSTECHPDNQDAPGWYDPTLGAQTPLRGEGRRARNGERRADADGAVAAPPSRRRCPCRNRPRSK